MIEQIFPDLYRIEVPLPKNPLRALNSYLIKGKGRFLIIDTGMNRQECLDAMLTALAELKVDLNRTDFFLTHIHADHTGLIPRLATSKTKVYFNQFEAAMINNNAGIEENLDRAGRHFLANGFPPDDLKRSLDSHPGRRFGMKQQINFCILKEGDVLNIGDYSLACLETPGHSPNHMCLYDARKKLLISGDHILADITPNISYWALMENPLKEYLASLDKVNPLEVNLVLPGHRSLMTDHRKRIRELQEHHRNRMREVTSALEKGPKTAYQVAPYITWDIDCKSWADFPDQQKWFAFGETLAHLIYMQGEGMIRAKTEGGQVVFTPA